MTTTSTTTVAAVQAAFVTAARLEVPGGVTVWRAWPGQQATQKMVFFTDVEWTTTEDAVMKAGRRYRNESYDANFQVWNLQPGDPPDDPGDDITATYAIYNACEEVVVEASSSVRSVAGVVNVVCQPVRLSEPLAFVELGGWGFALDARLSVTARLT